GRKQEIEQIIACLASDRLVSLTGAGGVGKTRLAIRAAQEVIEDYADGAWFVDLAPLSDPGLVGQEVASTLGVREQIGRPWKETISDHLRPKSVLLVLDNCEHL